MSHSEIRIIHSYRVWLPQTATWLYNQVTHLPAAVDSHIVCETTENLDQFGVPHIYPSRQRWHYMADRVARRAGVQRPIGPLRYEIGRLQPHVLHSHFGNLAWHNIPAARRHNLPHVVTFYGHDVNRLPVQEPAWRGRYAELFDHAALVLCEGPHMRQAIIALGCPPEKVKVQHLGIEVNNIEFRPRCWEPGRPLRVLMAATFTEKKGFPYALEALGQLQHELDLEITLIGDAGREPRNQAEKQIILGMIERYNLRQKVRLLGYQPYTTLFAEAYQHHIFLSPSISASDGDTEGGAPVALIDMLATGMPIVSTTHCDIPNVVPHGRAGLLAAERDVAGLIKHIRWLVQHPDQWAAMGQAGRQHVAVEFNAKVQGQRLAQHYQAVIA